MDIQSSEDAKAYAVEKTNRCLSHDETRRRLEELRDHLSRAPHKDEEQKEICKQIASLENWLKSDKFKRGISRLV